MYEKVVNVRAIDYKAKTTEIEGKIPRINGLATTAAGNAIVNFITNVIDLVKKTNYDEKLSDI